MNWIYTGRMSTKLKTFILRGSSWEVHISYENQGISSIPQNLLALSCIMFPLCSVGIVYFYHYSYLFLRNRTNTLPGSIICEVFKICDRVTCKKSFVKHRFITLKQYLFVIWIHKNSIIALAHSRHIWIPWNARSHRHIESWKCENEKSWYADTNTKCPKYKPLRIQGLQICLEMSLSPGITF